MFFTEWNSGYVFGVTSLDIKTIGFMIMVGCSFESNFDGLDRTFFKSQKISTPEQTFDTWHQALQKHHIHALAFKIQRNILLLVNALWFAKISRKKQIDRMSQGPDKGVWNVWVLYYHLLDKKKYSGTNWACSSFNHIKSTVPGWHMKTFKKSQNVTAKFQQTPLIHLGKFRNILPP